MLDLFSNSSYSYNRYNLSAKLRQDIHFKWNKNRTFSERLTKGSTTGRQHKRQSQSLALHSSNRWPGLLIELGKYILIFLFDLDAGVAFDDIVVSVAVEDVSSLRWPC
jgi:hypothetical protein